MILGLDLSTDIVGYGILSANKELIEYGHIVLFTKEEKKNKEKKTIESLIYKTRKRFVDSFSDIISKYNIEHVYIEKPYTYFSSGGSSAHTMSLLMLFGGMVVEFIVENVCDDISYIDSKTVKKSLGLKYSTKGLSQYQKRRLKKKLTIEAIADIYKNFVIRTTKKGAFEIGLDDEADAIALSMCHFAY